MPIAPRSFPLSLLVLALAIAGGSGCSTTSPVSAAHKAALSQSLILQAEAYDGLSPNGSPSLRTYPAPPLSAVGISHVDHSDWIRFDDVDFGAQAAAVPFTVRYATPNSLNEVRVVFGPAGATSPDGGVLVASLTTQANEDGNFSQMVEATVTTAPVSGVGTLFVVFDGSSNAANKVNGWGFGIGNFDCFRFGPAAAPGRACIDSTSVDAGQDSGPAPQDAGTDAGPVTCPPLDIDASVPMCCVSGAWVPCRPD